MEKFGYIVHDREISGLSDFVQRVSYKDYVKDGKPTLYIGYKKAKTIDGFKTILNKQISPTEFWTYNKVEQRADFQNDIEKFQRYLIDNLIKDIPYIYIQPYNLSYQTTKKFLLKLQSSEKLYIYIVNGMIYLCDGRTVYGVSMPVLKYCRIKIKRIIHRLKQRPNTVIAERDDEKIKNVAHYLRNKRYAVAYLLQFYNTE